jgi:hypothetical protein
MSSLNFVFRKAIDLNPNQGFPFEYGQWRFSNFHSSVFHEGIWAMESRNFFFTREQHVKIIIDCQIYPLTALYTFLQLSKVETKLRHKNSR